MVRALTRAGLKVAAVLLLCCLAMAATPSWLASDRSLGAQVRQSVSSSARSSTMPTSTWSAERQ
jgi:hypothetical protein